MPGPESRRPAAPTTRGDRSREAGCAKTSIEEKRFPVYERLFKGTNFPFDYLNRIKYTKNAVLCTSPSHSQLLRFQQKRLSLMYLPKYIFFIQQNQHFGSQDVNTDLQFLAFLRAILAPKKREEKSFIFQGLSND